MKSLNPLESKLDTLLERIRDQDIDPVVDTAIRSHFEKLRRGLPDPEVVSVSQAAIVYREEDTTRSFPRFWRWITSISAAALVMVWIVVEVNQPSGFLFARVIERVVEANGYAIRLDIQYQNPDASSDEEKHAMMERIRSMAHSEYLNKQMILVKSLDARSLGERHEGNRTLSGFSVEHEGIDYAVWADAVSGEPFEVELKGAYENGPSWTIRLERFVFDDTGSAVRTQVSSGFEQSMVTEMAGSMNDNSNKSSGIGGFVIGESGESGYMTGTQVMAFGNEFDADALTRSLQSLIGLNDGRFPKSLDPRAIVETYKNKNGISLPLSNAEQLQLNETLEKAAYAFSAPHRLRSRDWHYSGEGIRFGERKPVCWWKDGREGKYTIVYGDLTIEEKTQQPGK